MFPVNLRPSLTETFLISGQIIEIPKCKIAFDKWTGKPLKETFGGKPVLTLGGKPMFAELVVMALFIEDGWDARWIETYGRNKKEPKCLMEWKDEKYGNQDHCPIEDPEVLKVLDGIARFNDDSYAGCWDVVAWKDGKVVFAECKRIKKDVIRDSQVKWLRAGLETGLTYENFMIIEWDFFKM